tara:strand:+ start:409 stop:966 length:558 start_codon:yes stop_codon:yes gene_type:complete
MVKFTKEQISEGNAISIEVNKEIRKARRLFKKSTTEGGLDFRLGKLISEAKQHLSVERLDGKQLKELGINKVPSQRRSEAVWFFENQNEIKDFVKSNGFDGSSITALQSKMRKVAKATEKKDSSGDKENTEADTQVLPITLKELVAQTKVVLQLNGFTEEEFLDALIEASQPKQQEAVLKLAVNS